MTRPPGSARLAFRFEDDGSLSGTFHLPPLSGAVLLKALRAAAADLEHPHPAGGEHSDPAGPEHSHPAGPEHGQPGAFEQPADARPEQPGVVTACWLCSDC